MAQKCFAILEVISYADERNCVFPKIVSGQKAEGLIIMGTFKRVYSQFLRKNVTLPFTFMDTFDTGEKDSVIPNNIIGAYNVTNYLFEMGHSKIGFVGTRLATTSIDDRYLGYLKSMMEHGKEWREDWLIDDRDRESGLFDLEKHFQLPDEMPTAFFCNSDLTASYLMKKLASAGFAVPEDISVAGFDNYLYNQPTIVDITTYEINMKEMAQCTVEILLHKLEDPQYSTGVYMVTGQLISKDSVKRIGYSVPFV